MSCVCQLLNKRIYDDDAFLASAASTVQLQDEILGGSQPLLDESAESLKGRLEAS